MVVALALSALARGVWLARGAEPIEIYMTSWTHADGLLVGAGIALARANPRLWRALAHCTPWVFGASLVGLLLVRSLLSNPSPADDLYARAFHFALLASLFGAVMVLCIRSDERGKTLPLLENRLVRRVGALSYGIYVYHFFLVRSLWAPAQALFGRGAPGFVATLLAFALATYALAALSLRFIEAPALRLKRLFPRPEERDTQEEAPRGHPSRIS